ncbi:BamA/TamA family outer membrane protein [Flavobacterium muglaense]|uniref:Uncharacterized protein n=1 Tax=Flavobacterium muglaense TaxID=2764716 RepID=A0A923MYK2_9FLAO|nr:hypothetical protein [Flavobacterium muglaense]MBC5836981.1 hypothetical protein [Flavobacterium muglaense]MBC5843510.1 hypothetical protein [Flavobacterium muglaense]
MKQALLYLLLLITSITCYSQSIQLNLIGKSTYETQTIDSTLYNKNHLNTKSIENEIKNTVEKLTKKGFINTQTIAITKTNDSLYTGTLSLRKQIKKAIINIKDATNFKEKLSYAPDQTEIELPYAALETFLNNQIQYLEKNGYAFTTLKLTKIYTANETLHAQLLFKTEKQRKIDDITINYANNKHFLPKGFLTQIKKKYSKQIYNQKTASIIYKDFESISYATQTKYPEILFTTDSTKVFIYLKKRKSNNFDGYIGFNTDKQNKLTLNGYLDLKLENILLAGEQLTLFWKNDNNKQTTFRTNVQIPYLFNIPLSLHSQIEIFKQDSIFQNTKTSFELGYLLNPKTSILIGKQSTTSSDIQNTNSTTISDYKNAFYTVNLTYTKNENNTIFQKKTNLSIKTGTGTRTNTGKDNTNPYPKQTFLQIDCQHNFNINKKNYFNTHLLTYYLKSKTYTINELQRFGGINSIRGFNENSLQASYSTTLATEYRYLLTTSLYIHTILDYSILKNPFANSSTTKNQKLLSTGLGLGAEMKNGNLKISLANGSQKNEAIKFYNTILYISYNVKF